MDTACKTGNLELVKHLVGDGEDIHRNNDVAVRMASKEGHLELVVYFVGLGANIHALNDNALSEASKGGHDEVVSYLLSICDGHTNPHTNNSELVRFAASNGKLRLVKCLVENGADVGLYHHYNY